MLVGLAKAHNFNSDDVMRLVFNGNKVVLLSCTIM